ncbi:MAG: hypothetical protein GXN93_04765 [Candidatus Diapherotrites archaeon]|nr:hypothetical protein [Candidatus Diapherotrites archaeon]
MKWKRVRFKAVSENGIHFVWKDYLWQEKVPEYFPSGDLLYFREKTGVVA